MKKLLIRLIPDAIYEALEKTALHSERSLEAQARYILSCSVDTSGAAGKFSGYSGSCVSHTAANSTCCNR